MSRCFLLTALPPSFNAANLTELGKPVELFEKSPSIWKAEAAIEEIMDALIAEEFEPASDFIVLSGPQISLVYLALAVEQYMIGSKEFGSDHGWTALVFNARDREYQPVPIPLLKARNYEGAN